MNAWTVARASILAVMGIVAVLEPGAFAALSRGSTGAEAMAFLAAIGLTIVLWILPQAMSFSLAMLEHPAIPRRR